MIQDHIEDIIKCTRCGRCRAICPINEELGWESTNARGRMLLARALAEGEKPSHAMKRSFYTCLTCSMCTSTCPSGAKPDEVVEDARREMIAQGSAPPYYDTILENITRHGNSLGDTGPRNAWVPEELRLNKGKADVIYWSGCLTSYRQQQTALSSLKILSRFGARVLDDERCCGSPLLRLGGESVALEHNREEIERSGASTLVTGCAGCYKTLSESLDIEVLHVTQFLARHVDELPLERLPYRVSYHDPCHLGRCMKVYDEPREIIRRICDFEEMATSKSLAKCCGGGGGVRRGYGDLARKVAKKRLLDAPAGIDYIITACPMCHANLQDAGGKVLDISELVLMSMI